MEIGNFSANFYDILYSVLDRSLSDVTGVSAAPNMSGVDTNRHLNNMSLSLDVTESVTGVSAFAVSADGVWWRWLITEHLLRYGPAVCVCVATVGISLSIIVLIRLRRHLSTTLLYLLIAMMLELLPVYMHCGSYTLKQVILITC